MSTATMPANWRPPTKAEVEEIRARATDNHPGDVSFGHEDVEVLLRFIDYQDSMVSGLQEDLRDAGRELRDLERESANWQSRYEDASGGGW